MAQDEGKRLVFLPPPNPLPGSTGPVISWVRCAALRSFGRWESLPAPYNPRQRWGRLLLSVLGGAAGNHPCSPWLPTHLLTSLQSSSGGVQQLKTTTNENPKQGGSFWAAKNWGPNNHQQVKEEKIAPTTQTRAAGWKLPCKEFRR